MFNSFPDVMTVQQAAAALGVCEKSIYKLVNERSIGCRRVGRKILIPKVCLVDYITSARYTITKLQ